MASGRKPIPISVMKNETKKGMSKNTQKKRENFEVGRCEETFKPPRGLSKGARKDWNRIVRLYRQLERSVLNDLDQALLASYCESSAIYKAAEEEYQKAPLVGLDGKENPYLKIMWREGANIAKYAEQLCLSPVGRARMGVLAAKKEEEDDPAAAFFAKYGG